MKSSIADIILKQINTLTPDIVNPTHGTTTMTLTIGDVVNKAMIHTIVGNVEPIATDVNKFPSLNPNSNSAMEEQ